MNTYEIKGIINNRKETYSNYKDIELNNNSNIKIDNNDKDDVNNVNLKTESLYENVSDINDTDKYIVNNNDNKINSNKFNKYTSNENVNYSEERLTENNNCLSDLQNNYNYSSQIQLDNLSLLNRSINDREYKSQSIKLQPKNDKENYKLINLKSNDINKNIQNISIKDLEINNNLSRENINNIINFKNMEKGKSLIQYQNIFTLRGNKIISFNLSQKKFMLISPKDMTNGIFNLYISKNTSPPLTLNASNGFYFLSGDYIFLYNIINNSINIVTKLLSYHKQGGFIYINDEIYSLSGKDCLLCEKYSIDKNINIKLPSVNFERINSGLCTINNEYLYIFFGKHGNNSIERLNLTIDYISMNAYFNNWEFFEINNFLENGDKMSLERFTLFLDDYNNVIIFGGKDSKGNANQDIYGLNIVNNEINAIGKIDTSALYIGQNIQLNESIFAIYDSRNGLHLFNKELDYHEIYNFNI